MEKDLGSLVELATQGNGVAVDKLLQRFLPGLRGFLRLRAGKMLLDKESCSDLAQSVCRDVLENMDAFRYGGEAGFRSWLFTTALRKLADRYEYYRAAKRNAGREQPRDQHATIDELVAGYSPLFSPSQHAVAHEELGRIETAFSKLPDEQQQVILMARMMDLSRTEIAEEMGRSEGAVRTLLSRSLARLAEMLDAKP
jgi:RNA polymerase sigma-70 factor (ECF subfamily)